MKYHLITFGCQMNAADSQWLRRALSSLGWEEAGFDQARAYILNTCAVREKPELKVYDLLGRIREQQRRDPQVFAAVGGCTAQLAAKQILNRFPLVRLVFGPGGLSRAPLALDEIARGKSGSLALTDFPENLAEREEPFPDQTLPAQAGVTIMQGCDNFCAYCIVPYVRGRQKSRPVEKIILECEELIKRGVSEIMLLGQNVNSYGQDQGPGSSGFVDLLGQVSALPGLRRLRFTTSHPKDLSPELIEAYGKLGNLCPALHLPLQAGSDAVLKKMGRGYTAAAYLELVRALREACPDVMLTTDLIVGFPGESEDDFERTLKVSQLAGFDNAFSFMYNDRPGVAAERLPGKLSLTAKSERLARLQELIAGLAEAKLAARVGRCEEVLVEGLAKRQAKGATSWKGRDSAGRVVNFDLNAGRDLTGSYIKVKIVKAKKHSLLGEAEVDHD